MEKTRPIGGFGRIFESLYRGSMVGAGSSMFAVWGYVIANMRPDIDHGAVVDLNVELLAFTLGEEGGEVGRVIERLCGLDANSRSQEEGGRRLVRLDGFTYRVVNGAWYMSLRTNDERRSYFREAKRRERLKRGRRLPGEPVGDREGSDPDWVNAQRLGDAAELRARRDDDAAAE